MLKTCLIVFVSCSLAGVFQGLKIMENLKSRLLNMQMSRRKLFGTTSIVGIFTAAFGYNQTIALVMTNELMKACYHNADQYQLALDLENSAVVLSPLIPWNVGALVPTAMLNVSLIGFIPYAFYLYMLPLTYFIYCKYANRVMKQNIVVENL
jgi:NhaC family Na+:H+ antiporter